MRKRQKPELLHWRCAVDLRGFIDVRRNRLHTRQYEQERQREIAPDFEQNDHRQGHGETEADAEEADLHGALAKEIDRALGGAHLLEHRVHRTRERIEQHNP